MEGENPKMNSRSASEVPLGLNHLPVNCAATALKAMPNIAAGKLSNWEIAYEPLVTNH